MKNQLLGRVFGCFVAALSLAAIARAEVFVTGDLPRQAALGFRTGTSDEGLVVRDLATESAAAIAGLQDGDLIETINGRSFSHSYVGENRLEKLDGSELATLNVARAGRAQEISFTPPDKPYESIPGADSYYGVVDVADGARLRTIITKPSGTEGPLPAIFFLQWVSCGSLEILPGGVSRSILAKLAQESGRALIRVERSTSGDSEGPACHELDYDTELEHYREAYTELMQSAHVDAADVVLYGSSLGSTTAPLLAQQLQADGYGVAGIVVQGGGAVTYFERMLTFDRWYLERRPEEVAAADIHAELLQRVLFQSEYLIKGRSPDDIAKDSPEMAVIRADIRGLGDGHQYGRPYSWHQQAAKRNFLAAWVEIDAPVLVVFNEYDQFEGRHGHKLIVDTVNRLRPGTATYIEQPQVGHSNERYASIEDAYAGENGKPVSDQMAELILNWLRKL